MIMMMNNGGGDVDHDDKQWWWWWCGGNHGENNTAVSCTMIILQKKVCNDNDCVSLSLSLFQSKGDCAFHLLSRPPLELSVIVSAAIFLSSLFTYLFFLPETLPLVQLRASDRQEGCGAWPRKGGVRKKKKSGEEGQWLRCIGKMERDG